MAAAPAAPSGVIADGERDAVEVTWTAPSDGGWPITQYTAHAYAAIGDANPVNGCSTESASATTCVISGLASGTTYYVGVVARNADGTSTESTRVSVIAGNVPTSPTLTALARLRDGMEAVWTAPANDGGTPITGYTATAFLGSGPTAAVASSCSTTTELQCALTGLDPSVIYYVSVAARNAVGTGTSTPRYAALAGDVPGAPQNVTAVGQNGFALVSWNAPKTTGNSRITRYEAKAWTRPWEGNVAATCTADPTVAMSCNLGPLPNGTIFYVEVTATNAIGTGPANAPRIDVTPAALPDVPRSVTAARVGGEIRVHWSVPVSDGGFRIHAYEATAYADAAGTTPVGSCVTGGDSCAITGLSGAPVYVGVVARTYAGDSASSSPLVKVRLIDAPDAPIAISGSPRPEGMLVSWGPPLDNGGRPVLSYTAQAMDDAETVVSTCTIPAQGTTAQGDALKDVRLSCLLRGLQPGVSYTVEVTATTEFGSTTSFPTSIAVRSGKPSAPQTVVGFPQDKRLVMAWTVPASDGSSPIRSYRVRAWTKEKGGKLVGTCTTAGSPTSSIFTCTLTGQRDFEPTWVEVQAANAKGFGAASARVNLEAHPDVPSAPYRVRAVPNSAGLLVDWDAPFSDGGFPVYTYVATASDAPEGGTPLGSCTVSVKPAQARTTPPATRCTITGLDPDAYVYVTVTAENTVGVSGPSTPAGNLATAVS